MQVEESQKFGMQHFLDTDSTALYTCPSYAVQPAPLLPPAPLLSLRSAFSLHFPLTVFLLVFLFLLFKIL